MFSKKVMILKSDIRELHNIVCKIEQKENEFTIYINTNSTFNNAENRSLFCFILNENNEYEICRLKHQNNTCMCRFESNFTLNNISIFICEFKDDELNILSVTKKERIPVFNNLLQNQYSNILNKVNSLLDINLTPKQSYNTVNTQAKECNICEESYNCEKCFYKKEYFKLISQNSQHAKTLEESTSTTQEISLTNIEQQENEVTTEQGEMENKLDFYSQIQKTITHLFESKESDETLENLIEDSKFVKVENEETNDFYSVGIIYENQKPKYICYAIPTIKDCPPPENLAKFAQFLPTSDEKGYYLMYQDAKSGENIIIQTF